ncbi:MAG: hypothetical protein M0O94_03630 [Bacteroidales bacterium]|jgi:hypothetical protein|nr:hypothetical protein [Bacteroidales bacterium]MDD2322616.1 hypothetical protein [Bacteroidales bacterium]
MKKISRYLTILCCSACLFSCTSPQPYRQAEPATIIRYEQDLFALDKTNLKPGLQKLKDSYPVFLGGDINDTLNLIQLAGYLNDPLINEFYNDCQQKYPDLQFLEEEMGILIQNYKTYFPDKETFSVYTYVSGLDFKHPVVFIDSMLLISLDMYLGADYKHYDQLGIPKYISRQFTKENIARDAAESVIRRVMPGISGTTLLEEMITEGIALFGIHQLAPFLSPEIVIQYTPEQFNWCKKHEKELWAFLLKNDILFSPDPKYKKEFLLTGPSSPEFGDIAPARLGQFIGWQIVQAFQIKNPDISVKQIIEYQDAEALLKQANYKP